MSVHKALLGILLCSLALGIFQEVSARPHSVSALAELDAEFAPLEDFLYLFEEEDDDDDDDHAENAVLDPKGERYSWWDKKHSREDSDEVSKEKFACPSKHGDFPNPSDCSSYYKCKNYKAKRKHCQKHKKFDKHSKKCVDESKAVCEGDDDDKGSGEKEELVFKCPYPYGTYEHPKDCSKFFQCFNRKHTLRTCQKGELFDSRQRSCKDRKKVNCGSRFNPYETTTTTLTPEPTTKSPRTAKPTRQPRTSSPPEVTTRVATDDYTKVVTGEGTRTPDDKEITGEVVSTAGPVVTDDVTGDSRGTSNPSEIPTVDFTTSTDEQDRTTKGGSDDSTTVDGGETTTGGELEETTAPQEVSTVDEASTVQEGTTSVGGTGTDKTTVGEPGTTLNPEGREKTPPPPEKTTSDSSVVDTTEPEVETTKEEKKESTSQEPEVTEGITTAEPETTTKPDECLENDFTCIVDKNGNIIRCPEPTGLFPYPGEPQKFIQCDNNNIYEHECPEDMVFNPQESTCS